MAPPPRTPDVYPSFLRFYAGATGVGISVGITTTLFMTTSFVQRHITKVHAIAILYGIAVLFFIVQGRTLILWNRNLKAERQRLLAEWEIRFGTPKPPSQT